MLERAYRFGRFTWSLEVVGFLLPEYNTSWTNWKIIKVCISNSSPPKLAPGLMFVDSLLNFSLKFRNSSGLPALRLLGGEELTLELLNYLLKERHLLYGVRYLSTCFVIFRDALRGRRLQVQANKYQFKKPHIGRYEDVPEITASR